MQNNEFLHASFRHGYGCNLPTCNPQHPPSDLLGLGSEHSDFPNWRHHLAERLRKEGIENPERWAAAASASITGFRFSLGRPHQSSLSLPTGNPIGFLLLAGPLGQRNGRLRCCGSCICRAGPFEPTWSNTTNPGDSVPKPGNYISWLTSDGLGVRETPHFGSHVWYWALLWV